MKKVVFVLMFCLPVWMSAFSQTKQASIKELFHLMGQDSITNEMFKAVVPEINSIIKDSTERVSSEKMLKSTMQTMNNLSKRMMDEDMVALYDKYFSQKEINKFLTFYKSSAGQKLIKAGPEIQKDLMTIYMQKYMPEILKDIQAKTEVGKK